MKYTGILWNTYEILWNIFSNLLSFCEWNSWMELLTRLLQLQERDFGNWHYLFSALVNEIFARLLFSICFYKISHDYMIQMIRFHKSDLSFFGALQISTRQEMLFRDLRPCVSAKQWNVEEGFICFISLQARSKVILAFEDEQRCVNMYLWSPLDPTKLICFRWSSELWCTRHRPLAHVGMSAFWCCNGFQPLPCGQTWCLQLCLLVTLTSRIKCCRWPNWNGANCIFCHNAKMFEVAFSMTSSFWLKNSFCKVVVWHKIHSNNSRDPGHICTFWPDGKLMLWSFA